MTRRWPTLLALSTLTLVAALPADASSVRSMNDETTSEINDATSVVDLAGVWFFHDGDNPMFARGALEDRTWLPLRVPTDHISYDRRWHGFGWYRRHLYVGSRVLGNDLMLTLGPAREVVEVYINGTLVMQRGRFGSRLHGDERVQALRTLLPNGVLKVGENVIAVRVYDPSYTGGLPAGPLLLGPPDAVLDRVWRQGHAALLLRLTMAILAIAIGLAQAFIYAGHSPPHGDPWWAAGGGLSLALVHLNGTGVLTGVLPSLELAVRLPLVAQGMAILCFFNFFAARYDDFDSRRARLGRAVVTLFVAYALLAPERWVFLGVHPICIVFALLTTLYAAHLSAQAARRQEAGSLPLFAGLLGLMALAVYDGLVPSASDALPPWAATGGVLLLGLVSVMTARQTNADLEASLLTAVRLRKQLDARVWMDILDATASAINKPQAFLEAVAHEITREMEVRRCSIILPDMYGNLFIAACKGLPKQARHNAIGADKSISHYVFENGVVVTPVNLPEHLVRDHNGSRPGNYETSGFIAQPIRYNARTLAVLNVSDRNNGGAFTADDETHMAQVAERLALVLHRLDMRLENILALTPVVPDAAPRLIKVADEPKGRVLTPAVSQSGKVDVHASSAPPGATQPPELPPSPDEVPARVIVSKTLS